MTSHNFVEDLTLKHRQSLKFNELALNTNHVFNLLTAQEASTKFTKELTPQHPKCLAQSLLTCFSIDCGQIVHLVVFHKTKGQDSDLSLPVDLIPNDKFYLTLPFDCSQLS